MDIYLKEIDTIPEICDKVYAMGRAIGLKSGKLVEGDKGERKKKSANGGNRRERKLKKEIRLSQKRAMSCIEGENGEKQLRKKRRSSRN